VLAIILALTSAIGYGSSDFAAGLASRTASVIQVTLLASAAAAVVVFAALPFGAAHRPSGASLAWGAAAGAGGTLGAFALYLGFRYAAFSVAGPLSAVGTAGFSVLAGLLLGERPSTLALIGIVLALPAIVGVSASAADTEAPREDTEAPREGAEAPRQGAEGRPAAGVAAGLIAGACFALLLVGLDRSGAGAPGDDLWPVAAAQVAELAVAGAAAALTRNLRLPKGRPGWLAVITGVTGAAGTILYFFASRDGFLAITAVLTSLYPASTIVLARVILGERLTRLRLTGLALAGACVALIAAGGAG
jgi:drug/metabolite transporter (DMT)-like permease